MSATVSAASVHQPCCPHGLAAQDQHRGNIRWLKESVRRLFSKRSSFLGTATGDSRSPEIERASGPVLTHFVHNTDANVHRKLTFQSSLLPKVIYLMALNVRKVLLVVAVEPPVA
jgi:hypothetical protein